MNGAEVGILLIFFLIAFFGTALAILTKTDDDNV